VTFFCAVSKASTFGCRSALKKRCSAWHFLQAFPKQKSSWLRYIIVKNKQYWFDQTVNRE